MKWSLRTAGWIAASLALAAASVAQAQERTAAEKSSRDRYGRSVNDAASEHRILFTEDGGLFAMRPDGSEIERIIPRSATCTSAVWSPDGREIAFVGEVNLSRDLRGRGIYVVRADGTQLRKVADTRGFPTRPAWSPAPALDGEPLIVFSDAVEDNEEQYDLFGVHPDGSGLCNLTQTPEVKETHPTWSPDAGRVAFVATYQMPIRRPARRYRNSRRTELPKQRCVQDVMICRLARSDAAPMLVEPENVTGVRGGDLGFDSDSNESHRFESLTWAHHAQKLAVVVHRAPRREQSDVWIIDLGDVARPRNLTRTRSLSEEGVTWAPDDSHLLYRRTGDESAPSALCLARARRKGKPIVLQIAVSGRPEDWQRGTSRPTSDVHGTVTPVEGLEFETPR